MPVQTMETVKSRMKNPAMVLPEVLQTLLALHEATEKAGVPSTTIGLVQLRAIKSMAAAYASTALPRPQESG